MKKEPNGQEPQIIKANVEDTLSLEAILEEARELRLKQGIAKEEESRPGAVGEEGEAVRETLEAPALPKWNKPEPELPTLVAQEKKAAGKLGARQGVFASIRNIFQSKAKHEDEEPDELESKYGTISLGNAKKPPDETGRREEDSFFFGENPPAEEEEVCEEFSSIFDQIQQGRKQDQQSAVDRGDTPAPNRNPPAENTNFRQAAPRQKPEDMREPAESKEREEGPLPLSPAEELIRVEEKEEKAPKPKKLGPPEEEPCAKAEEKPAQPSGEEEAPKPEELEPPEQEPCAKAKEKPEKRMSEDERKTAESLETADRLLSQDYVTGEIDLEEVIANAEKLVQKRIVPFGKDQAEACAPEPEANEPDKNDAKGTPAVEPNGKISDEKAPEKTMEWNIFEAASNRYEQHFGKPQPARKAPARPPQESRKEKQETARLYRPGKRERFVVPGGRLDGPVREEYAAYRSKTTQEPGEPTRLFDVVKSGEAPAAGMPAPPVKGKKQKAAKKKAPLLPEQPKPHKERFHLFGDEPETSPEEAVAEEEEYIDDYTEPGDAFSVRAEIVGNVRRLLLRTGATAVLTVLGIVLAVFQRVEAENPAGLFAEHVYLYPIFNALLLLITAGCCFVPIGNGLSSLVKLRGNSDSTAAFAVLAAAVQGVSAFFTPEAYITGTLSLYTPLVVLALFLNSAGKLMMVRRIQQNFKFVSAPDHKEAVKIFTDPKLSVRMCRGMGVEVPLIAYARKSGFLTDFLRLSYEPDPSEKLAGRIAPFGALAALLVCGGIFFVTWDIQQAIASFSITACLCVPMCCVLAVNRPLRGFCRQMNRKGAMLVGYPGVRQFADVNVIQADANELYPQGSVVLHGIKTFSGQRIDESILQAAAVMNKVGGPLAATFGQIIQGRENILPRVEALDYEDEMGIVAWVGGARVLLGNRRLLEEHGIAPPSADYEKKYLTGERQATYLASGGDLVAMFVVTYHPDDAVMEELQRLEDNGVSLLIRTYDSNITAQLVSDHYKLSFRSVKIMPYQESRVFEILKEEPEEHTRAYLAIRGKAPAMHRVVAACVRFKSNISLSLILQMTGVVFSVLLIGLLAFFGGLAQMGTVEMLLYALFWTAAVLIVPFLRKP